MVFHRPAGQPLTGFGADGAEFEAVGRVNAKGEVRFAIA